MKYPFVENIVNERGNAVRNQFIIQSEEGLTFQSYHTTVAHISTHKHVLIDTTADMTQTTKRYLKIFLNETYKETLEKINKGEYTVARLN